jgi:phosphatidylglycerophosphate synthase
MIDGLIRPWIDPPLARAASYIARTGASADAITIGGGVLGVAGAAAVAAGQFTLAFVLLIANRFADGLDGPVARLSGATDRGAFLDIALDFLVYASVPLAFAWRAGANALPAAFLLASFLANGSAFLAFSVIAGKRGLTTAAQGKKSIYYLAGLAEGSETVVFMIAVCLFPQAFPAFAVAFAILCWISAAGRLVLGWKLLG